MNAKRRSRSFLKRAGTFLFCLLVLVASNANVAYAGFGITPPYVESNRLTRGSVYHQVINLVRSDPTEDLQATITMDIPGAQNWFSVDVGNSFIVPKGQTQMPITVTVNVPQDAPFQEYTGTIRIRTSPVNTTAASTTGVSIALGAQIDVDIKVVDKIQDFTVRQVRVTDMEEGRTLWGLFFPGKIRFFMTIQNTGNTTYGPTKTCFDIYDSQQETLLEHTCNTNSIAQIPAFATQEVLAELPTRLPAGAYVAEYTIYKGNDVAQQSTINLSISDIGTVPGYQGYGFDGLTLQDKLKVVGVIGTPLLLLVILIVILIRKRRQRRARSSSYSR